MFDVNERRRAEVSIMVSLAGRLGELLMPKLATGYRDDTVDIDQERAIAAATELTAEQAGWLYEAEHHETPPDEDRAFEMARRIAGDEAAGALVHFLSLETRRLVFSHLVRSLVPPVVDLLLARGAIPGEAVRDVVETITGEALKHEKEARMVRAAAKQVDPNTPRISGDTPISKLMIRTRAILRSEAGPCSEGVIVKIDDPRIAVAPECFNPLSDRLDG
jgi:hypothetical protein